MTGSAKRILIVGASVGGLAVAENLRLLGYDGAITVLDQANRQPCDRPPLSKDFLTDELTDPALPYAAQAEADGIDILLGREATSVSLCDKVVTCATGEVFRFDELVLACGSVPRRL